MGKRANNQAPKVAAKKMKIEPALATVVHALKKASHLPEECSTMLANMLPFSLAIPSEERQQHQQRIVGMVEETMLAVKSEMQTAVAAEDAKLDGHKATMATLVEAVKAAEAALAVQLEAFNVTSFALAEATTVANASGTTLAEKQAAQATADAKLASVQEEKVALETAFQEHFQVPMAAGEGPHFKELEPFLQSMELETSFRNTLPGTCGKTKENRGSFDDVILEQLEKFISEKITFLTESVVTETSVAAQCAAATAEAETHHNTKKDAQSQATTVFEASQTTHAEAEAQLVKSNEAVNAFCPELEAATGLCDKSKLTLSEFEAGPLSNFTTYKTKTALVATEAAPLGA